MISSIEWTQIYIYIDLDYIYCILDIIINKCNNNVCKNIYTYYYGMEYAVVA